MTSTFYAPNFDIRVSGLTIAADVSDQVVSVGFDNNLELADMFTLVIRNDNNALTDSPLFDLGQDVEVHMGYGRDVQPMMLGEITSVQPSFPESGGPTISVTGYDKSYRLRHNQPDRHPWEYVPDSAIAAQIAAEHLLVPVVDPSPVVRSYVQQTTSDFAFLQQLARRSGFEALVDWDRLHFRVKRPQTEAIALEWGRNLSSFTPRLSNASMTGMQVIRSYNQDLAEAVVGIASAGQLDLDNIVERLGGSVLDMLTDLGRRVIRDEEIDSPLDAAGFAESLLKEILEGMFEGTGSCIGIPDLRAGEMVNISGVGQKFRGAYRLKKVTHRIDGSGYRTSFEVTQRAGASMLSLLRRSIAESPSPTQRESFDGVVVGTVTNNVDRQGQGRIRVRFPWFSDRAESAWARCSTPMAGAGRGMYFLPDIGDEVLVSFQHGDFSRPVVIGGLWNGVSSPPVNNADGLNSVREVRTAAGHHIRFEDKEGSAELRVQHANGSKLQFGSNGSITIEATGDIRMQAGGSITLAGTAVDVV